MFGATCIHISVAGLNSYTRPHMLMGVQGGESLAMDTVWWKPYESLLVVLRIVKGVFCLFDNYLIGNSQERRKIQKCINL